MTIRRVATETLGLILAIQVGFLLVSWPSQTDMLFDLSGALTFIAAFWYTRARGPRTLGGGGTSGETSSSSANPEPVFSLASAPALLTVLATAWAARLGGFLFWRVLRTGGDSRFERFRGRGFARFAAPWALQVAWVAVVGLPVYAANLAPPPPPARARPPLAATDVVGLLAAAVGLVIETVADFQKWAAGRDAFPDGGLFAFVRYPNYAGEILVWTGAWLASLASIPGALERAIAALSPVTTYVLLRHVSGVPMSEASRLRRFGDAYRRHARRVPLLVPRPDSGR